ncbi:hypothetical protein GYB22_02535 [bacterium]|nr:hypothetical protein [bacterium]
MERKIDEIIGEEGGPLLLYVAGIHGNEYPGTKALEQVFSELRHSAFAFKGKAIALRGNLEALKQGKRFIDLDLNRIWKRNMEDPDFQKSHEMNEMLRLKGEIEASLGSNRDAAFLLDLHTTSAPTIPFIVTRQNQKYSEFIESFKVPYVTGLDGLLEGTMLDWFSDKGCGLAFEAGQHESATSVLKHRAFILLSMIHSGFITNATDVFIQSVEELLDEELKPVHSHFILDERYEIQAEEQFKMEPGFTNFQKVYKGEILARNKFGLIQAAKDANIFMPLYQEEGDDGFFIIKPKN